jgi:two-component system nitrogen regulation response regulator GlnG
MSSGVWIADDDPSMLWVIEKAIRKQGNTTRIFENGDSLMDALGQGKPDLVVTDVRMPGMSGFELLEKINQVRPGLPVIILTAFGDLDSAVDAYKYGAYEYLTKPFDIDELLSLVSRGLDSGVTNPGEEYTTASPDKVLLGESPAIQEVFRVIGRIARSNKGVLIRGESGTGKELVANAIHCNSLRRDKTMVAINTAAIPAELLESELFGHEKGAFTGAHSRRIGRFEQAHNATLFLDEIGDMPLNLQTRLLRVLSEGRFFRVGGRKEITVDVRIIAATNQNLETLVEMGQFRNDLFHRLNVLSVRVPELRERTEDIPILVDHFLNQSAYENSSEPRRLGAGVLEALQQYKWPGNIRELENTIQQLAILCAGSQIELSDIPDNIISGCAGQTETSWQEILAEEATQRLHLGEKGLAKSLGYEFEQVLIRSALQYTAGYKQKAAALLGWGRNTLARKIKGASD